MEATADSQPDSEEAIPSVIPTGAVVVTKKGIKAAIKVKEIQHKFGFCSLEKLAEAYGNSSVDFPKHLTITKKQILNADTLLGTGGDPARIRDSAQFSRNVPASAEQKVDIVAGELVTQIDLSFEEGLIFLFSIRSDQFKS